MKRVAVLALLALAACGADGAPLPPTKADTAHNGVKLGGAGWFGVTTTLK